MSAFSVGPVSRCPRAADGRHRYAWGSSDMTVLTSYARHADRSAVVRLSCCRSCGGGLLSVSSVEAGDDDLGELLSVEGAEVGES